MTNYKPEFCAVTRTNRDPSNYGFNFKGYQYSTTFLVGAARTVRPACNFRGENFSRALHLHAST